MRITDFIKRSTLGLAAFLAFTQASYAELIITGSTHPGVEIGSKLPDNTPLNIPKDVTVNITKTPENETYTLKGPYTGTLKDYKEKRKCRWIDRFFGRCSKDRDRPDPVGGVRSIKVPTAENKDAPAQ